MPGYGHATGGGIIVLGVEDMAFADGPRVGSLQTLTDATLNHSPKRVFDTSDWPLDASALHEVPGDRSLQKLV